MILTGNEYYVCLLVTYTNAKFLTALNLGDNSSQTHFENENFQIELGSLIKTFSKNNDNLLGNSDSNEMAKIEAISSTAETTAAVLKAFANATSSLTVLSSPPIDAVNRQRIVLNNNLLNNTSFALPIDKFSNTSNRFFFFFEIKTYLVITIIQCPTL